MIPAILFLLLELIAFALGFLVSAVLEKHEFGKSMNAVLTMSALMLMVLLVMFIATGWIAWVAAFVFCYLFGQFAATLYKGWSLQQP